MPGVMWMSRVGLQMTVGRWLILLAYLVAPLGILKILCDCWLLLMKC
jgi:hypothetical protein